MSACTFNALFEYVALAVLCVQLSVVQLFLHFSCHVAGDDAPRIALHEDQPNYFPIASGQLLGLPVHITVKTPSIACNDITASGDAAQTGCPSLIPVNSCPLSFTLTVSGVDGAGTRVVSLPLQVELRCRSVQEPFVFTFIDHDGSVSSAAAVAPLGAASSAPSAGLPVLLSVHGTGVSAQAQAEAYKVWFTCM